MCTVIHKSLKQFSVRKQIMAAFVLTFIFKSVQLQQCGQFALNKKHFGKRLKGFNISTSTEDSIGTCVKKCFQLTHCLSTNFDTVSKECDLNNITADAMTGDVVKSEKSVLSDLSAWPKAMVGSCGDKPCHGRDICMPAGNSFLCRNSDCPKAPLFRNTTSTGSVAIGGKIVYTCTRPLHRLIGKDNMHCGWMNTWPSIEEITCIAVECPNGWKRYNDSCYLAGDGTGMIFSGAVSCCEGLGADLVQIESEDENTFVKESLLLGSHYWLGLTDGGEEGVWRWYKTGELATYSDWVSGEPDGLTNGQVDEDCAGYNGNSQTFNWSDVICQRTFLPICELRLSV